MEKISQPFSNEIVFGSSDSRISQAIRRAIRQGKLRKLAPRLYTTNMLDDPKFIVSRNCFTILGELFPGAILSHRSAFESKPSSEGVIVLTYKYDKK